MSETVTSSQSLNSHKVKYWNCQARSSMDSIVIIRGRGKGWGETCWSLGPSVRKDPSKTSPLSHVFPRSVLMDGSRVVLLKIRPSKGVQFSSLWVMGTERTEKSDPDLPLFKTLLCPNASLYTLTSPPPFVPRFFLCCCCMFLDYSDDVMVVALSKW